MGCEDLFVQRGGDGRALLLLHGLGATGDVWDGPSALLPGHWPGLWSVPGLPGCPARASVTREKAAGSSVKVAGLTGLVPADAPFVDAAVISTGSGWGPALDPAALFPLVDRLAAAAGGGS